MHCHRPVGRPREGLRRRGWWRRGRARHPRAGSASKGMWGALGRCPRAASRACQSSLPAPPVSRLCYTGNARTQPETSPPATTHQGARAWRVPRPSTRMRHNNHAFYVSALDSNFAMHRLHLSSRRAQHLSPACLEGTRPCPAACRRHGCATARSPHFVDGPRLFFSTKACSREYGLPAGSSAKLLSDASVCAGSNEHL